MGPSARFPIGCEGCSGNIVKLIWACDKKKPTMRSAAGPGGPPHSAEVHMIGGGLAGCEAAWQVARAGGRAVLYEMRPQHPNAGAQDRSALAELVCSNSLKSEQENTAPWLLKEELRRLGSLLIGSIAPRTRVPAGHALTVDREHLRRRGYPRDGERPGHRNPARRSDRRSIRRKSGSSRAGR